jgi:hypothetical protein
MRGYFLGISWKWPIDLAQLAKPFSSKPRIQDSTVREASPNSLAISGQVIPCARRAVGDHGEIFRVGGSHPAIRE